jgi:hypothetical protein
MFVTVQVIVISFSISFIESWFLSVPLGMSGNLILDSQISASSSMSYTSGPGNARLGLTTIPGVQDGGWIAGDHDREPWLQVDFIVNATVKGLRKQNLYDSTHSVTKYTLAYGDDGETFSDYKTNNQKGTEVGCCYIVREKKDAPRSLV